MCLGILHEGLSGILSLDVADGGGGVLNNFVQPRGCDRLLVRADGGDYLGARLQMHFDALPGRILLCSNPLVTTVGKQLGGFDESVIRSVRCRSSSQ